MSIRNKLILYTFTSIFITLVIVGIAVNSILSNLYNNNAISELNHTYSRFQLQLNSIRNDILTQTLQISTDISIIATLNLVNRYQNKSNYQPFIFNNDKKKMARQLLKQISVTDSDRAIIYSKTGDIVAYAIKSKSQSEIGISSYKKGKELIIKSINNYKWITGELPASISSSLVPLKNEISFLSLPGNIEYLSKKNNFLIESNRIITRSQQNGKLTLLGTIRVNKSLDDVFFEESSRENHNQISLLLHSGHKIHDTNLHIPDETIKNNSHLFGSTSSASKQFITNKTFYIQPYVWPTDAGNNYLLITTPRSEQISALNKSRTYMASAFVFTAFLVMLFGIYWLNRLISNPLNLLTIKARISKDNQYPQFPVSSSNDEISILGNILNNMVDTIKERERDLNNRTKQLNNAQHLAKIGDWDLDIITDTMQWSDEAYNIFELDPAETTPSLDTIFSVMHPDDIENANSEFETSISNKRPFNIFHRINGKDKHTKYIHVYGESFYDDSGKPIRSVGTMQDITEQTIKDEQLRRTQKMDALGKLTGGIAHDFNNMLSVILGFAELLQISSHNNDKNQRHIKEILLAGDRAKKLTAKLLSFSRKDTSSSVKTDINQLLRNEQHMLEKTLTVRITLRLELEDDLWAVWLDKDELEDAIVNMCINAMHAIPVSGELTLSTRNINLNEIDTSIMDVPPGDYVLVSITDTGDGMDADTLQHIFEPFFTTKEQKGTGLGMSQVYGFVKRSNGSIHIYSEPGHGTRINIYFPRYIDINDSITYTTSAEETENLRGASTILVVDDEPALRMLAHEILTSNGYEVLLADSGNQALEILKNKQIDLVLSDVIMPGMNGYQLAELIKQNYPQVKIQIASGFSDIQDSASIDNNLYKNRLQKPFNSKTLLKRLKDILLET